MNLDASLVFASSAMGMGMGMGVGVGMGMGVGMGTSHGSRVTGLPCALLGAARESLCNLVIPYSWGADERLNVA